MLSIVINVACAMLAFFLAGVLAFAGAGWPSFLLWAIIVFVIKYLVETHA